MDETKSETLLRYYAVVSGSGGIIKDRLLSKTVDCWFWDLCIAERWATRYSTGEKHRFNLY